MKKLLLLAAGLAAVCAAAPAFAAEPTSCVRNNDIKTWSSLDDQHVVLENYHHQKVLLKLIGTCSGFKFDEGLEIRSRSSFGLSCVAAGDTIVTHRGIRGVCSIVSVTPYTGDAKSHDGDHGGDHSGDNDHHDNDHHDHSSY
jgi:hypothetical protein